MEVFLLCISFFVYSVGAHKGQRSHGWLDGAAYFFILRSFQYSVLFGYFNRRSYFSYNFFVVLVSIQDTAISTYHVIVISVLRVTFRWYSMSSQTFRYFQCAFCVLTVSCFVIRSEAGLNICWNGITIATNDCIAINALVVRYLKFVFEKVLYSITM